MNRLVVFDLETTGLYPEKGDMILEIAGVSVVDDLIETGASFHTYVNPGRQIPKEATRINNITDEMVQNAPPIGDVLPRFFRYIQDSPLVAHNACFDVGFIDYFSSFFGFSRIRNRIIDTLALSREIFPLSPYHNLDAVLERLEIPFQKDTRHGALEDARLTALAFIAMKSRL
jgi:DNA polymerase-3 subunit epsilon